MHEDLIGRPASRAQLNTPVLMLDRTLLDANIGKMAAFAKRHGLVLRPHAKTHKSVDIARRQIEAGAIGICCAKLGEAEALAAAGISNIHLTSPVVTPQGIARLVALASRSPKLSVVTDNVDVATALARGTFPAPLTVLVDIDPGNHRTGVATVGDAIALATLIARSNSLSYGGVQFYCGSQQHIVSFSERRDAIGERTAYLSRFIAGLRKAGLGPPVITGGGTGTYTIDAQLGMLTELQVGSYIFMDREYASCDLDGSGSPPFATALTVDATVISTNTPGMVTIDAGIKAFATEAGAPVVLTGLPAGSTYRFMGDEHGAVVLPPGEQAPPVGSRVTLMTPHCDPTVNLYDRYHVLDGDTLTAIWPITARGRSA